MDDWIELGHVMFSNGIQREVEETEGFRCFCMACVNKHSERDWGDISEEDKEANEFAAENGGTIYSEWAIPKYYCIGYADMIVIETDKFGTYVKFPHEP